MKIRYFCWCVRRGSNPDRRRRRPLWYPIPLRAHFCLYKTRIMKSESAGDLPKPRRGPLGKVSGCALARTTDRRRRRPLWYPIPLRAHFCLYKTRIMKSESAGDLPKPRREPLGKVSGCALARTTDRRRRRPLWYPIPPRAHFCLYKTRIMKSKSAGDLPKPRKGPLGKVSGCALARTTDRRSRGTLWTSIPFPAQLSCCKVRIIES